jgi:hypothetical protein
MNKLLGTVLTSLEEELKVLKAQIQGSLRPSTGLKSFSDLEGIWKGKTDFSFEEIQQSKAKTRNSFQ